jgi:fatty acid desaturase
VAIEFPTLALIFAMYAGWLTVTRAYGSWPLWVVVPAGIVVLVLHGSLQHEMLHGHPTRWSWINRLLGIVPLSLWLPYDRYRQNHLTHHIDERLTDPVDDPEAFYWSQADLERMSPFTRRILEAQQTLAGRIVLGSFWQIGLFWRAEILRLRAGQAGVARMWLEHLALCVPVLWWVKAVCGMPIWLYVIGIVLPANGILLIRSFAEHRAKAPVRQRVAVVEGSWLLGPLFLFNNLHSLHHESPMIPWYELNARYRENRERLLAENGGLLYVTYFDVARRFLFRAHDVLQHPTGRVPPTPA